MSWLAETLRETQLALKRIDRRVAAMLLEGPVAQRDETKWRVRLDLGEDPETGEKILSPWVRPQSASAGQTKISSSLPKLGEHCRLVSPSGVVGPDSVAEYGGFTDAERRPEQAADEWALTNGDNRIGVKPAQMRHERTDASPCAVALRDQGRVVVEIKEKLARFKIKLDDDWYRLADSALVPTTEEEV